MSKYQTKLLFTRNFTIIIATASLAFKVVLVASPSVQAAMLIDSNNIPNSTETNLLS